MASRDLPDKAVWLRWVIGLLAPAVLAVLLLAGRSVIHAQVGEAVAVASSKGDERADKLEQKIEDAKAEHKKDLERHEDKSEKRLDRIEQKIDHILEMMARQNRRRPE